QASMRGTASKPCATAALRACPRFWMPASRRCSSWWPIAVANWARTLSGARPAAAAMATIWPRSACPMWIRSAWSAVPSTAATNTWNWTACRGVPNWWHWFWRGWLRKLEQAERLRPMLFLRPSREDDLDGLMRLAGMTGAGFTSLSPDRHLLRRRLRHSAYSFADALESRDDAHYLFALEDSDSGRLAGVCGILAATGRDNPFYSYRVGLVVNASRRLNISNAVQTLYLCNDYTGCAEKGSLCLDPDYRGRSAGRLLSRSRFLFLAEFRQRFPERVIAEMRGVSD